MNRRDSGDPVPAVDDLAAAGPQGRARIRALLDAAGLRPRRSLGQHFLADPNVTRRIVRLAGVGAEDRVVEIGAGTGTLTAALAATGARVVAYEIDGRLVEILREGVGVHPNVEIREGDVAKIDLAVDLGAGPWTMVSNLPYNVGTGIVLDALRGAPEIVRFVVMVQHEVADRLLATAGTRTYGVPSVIVGLHARGRMAFRVSASVFVPPPKVDSAVVELDRVPAPADAEAAIELAAAAFGQRRKMLRRSLAGVLADPEGALLAAGIDPTSRAEVLSVDEYVALAGSAQ
jgi:16S rRNA (adenine1518-N6/adenine1519-N6)-dimethyltransferase